MFTNLHAFYAIETMCLKYEERNQFNNQEHISKYNILTFYRIHLTEDILISSEIIMS